MTLDRLKTGETATIKTVGGAGALAPAAGYGPDSENEGDNAEGGPYGGPNRNTNSRL